MERPVDLYGQVMLVVQQRLDMIEVLRLSPNKSFASGETAAFHGRKVVEGLAFACLATVEVSGKRYKKDMKKAYNAERIFRYLSACGHDVKISAQQRPRKPKPGEHPGMEVQVVVEGNPNGDSDMEQLLGMYGRLHAWLHEVNPFGVGTTLEFYNSHHIQLWDDLRRLDALLACHTALIDGHGFICQLRGPRGLPEVAELKKFRDL